MGQTCEIDIAGGITIVNSRSNKRKQSGTLCSNLKFFWRGEEFLVAQYQL